MNPDMGDFAVGGGAKGCCESVDSTACTEAGKGDPVVIAWYLRIIILLRIIALFLR